MLIIEYRPGKVDGKNHYNSKGIFYVKSGYLGTSNKCILYHHVKISVESGISHSPTACQTAHLFIHMGNFLKLL